MALNPQNLQPVKTKEEARKRGKAGGIKSGESRRKKKLVSQIYAEFLSKKHNIEVDGKKKQVTGESLLDIVVNEVLKRADSSSVSMLKEIREATEGSKINIDANVSHDTEFKIVKKP